MLGLGKGSLRDAGRDTIAVRENEAADSAAGEPQREKIEELNVLADEDEDVVRKGHDVCHCMWSPRVIPQEVLKIVEGDGLS
jgi:hypothetical protein